MFSSSPVSCARDGAAAGGALTATVPRPGARSIRPSAASRSSALRTVTRATPNCLTSCISGGTPSAKRPSASCSRSTK